MLCCRHVLKAAGCGKAGGNSLPGSPSWSIEHCCYNVGQLNAAWAYQCAGICVREVDFTSLPGWGKIHFYLKLICEMQVFVTECFWLACKRDFQSRIKTTTSSGVIPFNFFCTVMDGFLLWGVWCLHLMYSSHYPPVIAAGGLSNPENQNEQLLRKTGTESTVS